MRFRDYVKEDRIKMKKLLTITATISGCLLAAYFLLTPQVHEQDDHDDHDHDHNFLPFSQELAEANHIVKDTVSPGTLKRIVRAPAQITIASDQKAHILPKASGIAVKAYKNLGEMVDNNELVATLESKEMAEAKSNYLSSVKKEQLALAAFIREKNLHEKNVSSLQEFYDAESAKNEAGIERELAKQKLHTLGLSSKAIEQLPHESPEKLRVYELRSPIRGKVIARHITPGEMVTNDHEVYTIADLSSVWAEIHVFAKDRPSVKEGQFVVISTDAGQSVPARVVYLSPIIDPETRTSTALAQLDNMSDIWHPGTFVQAELLTDETTVPLMVKKTAIQNIDGIDVVFIAASEGFEVRPITKGRSDEENCEVISGLEAGEEYACKNTFLLKADLKKEEAEHMD